MKRPGYRQVTVTRLLLLAASLPFLAACGGDCDARLTIVNASGLAIASGTLRASGTHEAVTLGSLPLQGSREYRFHDLEPGAYSFDIRFADGTSLRDSSLGYLTRKMRFRDTLVVHAPGASAPLALKQNPGGCPEGPRMKTVVREVLKKVF
jgi:hypothetical protein